MERVVVVSVMVRQLQALEASLIRDKFCPVGASVQAAIISITTCSCPWRLRICATGACVMVTVVVPLATVATASDVWVVVVNSMTVLIAR